MWLTFLVIGASLALIMPVLAEDRGSPALGPEGTWAIETVVSHWSTYTGDLGIDGKYLSMVMDKNDISHLSYFDTELNQVVYVTKENGRWVQDTVWQTSGTYSTSIALDEKGNPSIVFSDVNAGRLIYAKKMGTLWKTSVIDSGSNVGYFASHVVGPDGSVHVSYSDGRKFSSLKYAILRDSAWTKSTLDIGIGSYAAGNTGYDSCIRLDVAGNPRISYRDGNTYGTLRYIEYNGTAWSKPVSVDTGWGGKPGEGDRAGNSGYYPMLTLDNNNPVITYYDQDNHLLMMATRSSEGLWRTMFWSSPGDFFGGGDIGRYSSITIDAAGDVYISYYDATNGDLRFLHPRKNGVDYAIIDPEGDTGKYSVMVLDSAERPHVVYYDATNMAIKVASWSPGAMGESQ